MKNNQLVLGNAWVSHPLSVALKNFDDLLSDWEGFAPVLPRDSYSFVEKTDHYLLEIIAPRFEKKDIKIDITNNILNISAEKTCDNETYSLAHSFSIPRNIDTNTINAKLENGILSINLKKSKKSVDKVVDIE